MAKAPLELLNNVEHWRDRAEEARVHAEQAECDVGRGARVGYAPPRMYVTFVPLRRGLFHGPANGPRD